MTRSERGEVSLISVLVACTLLLTVLGATLGLFEGFIAKAGDATRRTDAEDVARTAADRVARDLRNIASPTTVNPLAIDVLGPRDLVFRAVNPAPRLGTNTTNTQRVRYCLDGIRQLHRQTQTWSSDVIPALPSVGACPGSGWTTSKVVAQDIVNDTTVPVFSYDTADPVVVSTVHVDLMVDTDLLRLPPATRLSTGVFLRNQNRRPRAAFTVTKTGSGYVLNGSSSEDDDNDPLIYTWSVDGVVKGTGITFTYTPAPAWATGSGHTIKLQVKDPAELTNEMTQAVTG